MSFEAIKQINEAEESAKKTLSEATAAAKKAAGQSETAGRLAIDAAIKKAEDELRELTKKADEKATSDAQALAGNTENKKAAMRTRADSQLDKAAMLIVERVVNS